MASSAGPGGGPQLLPEVKGAAAVAVWLAELGYTRLQSVFAGQNVDALSLSELSDTDLSLLGISNARDRAKLFSRAKAFLAQGAASRRQAVSAPPAPAAPLAVSGALVPLDPKAQPNVMVSANNANISALLAHPASADPALNAQAPVGKKPRGRPPLYASLVPLHAGGAVGGSAEEMLDEVAPDRNAKKRMQRAWRKAQRLHVCEVPPPLPPSRSQPMSSRLPLSTFPDSYEIELGP